MVEEDSNDDGTLGFIDEFTSENENSLEIYEINTSDIASDYENESGFGASTTNEIGQELSINA
jgi:hypothetical protein